MLRQSLATKSVQLRESYIGISKYVRGYHLKVTCPASACIRRYPHRRRVHNFLRSFSSFGNRLEAPGDVTEGFPSPPDTQATSRNPSGPTKSTTAATERPLEELYPSDPGPDTPIEAAASQPTHNASERDGEQSVPIRMIKDNTGLRRGFRGSHPEETSDIRAAGAETRQTRKMGPISLDTRRLTL